MYLTIDPGNDTGWAYWGDGKLLACGVGKLPYYNVEKVWIEDQTIRRRGKARPKDILKLAHSAAEVGGVFRHYGAQVEYVQPITWKGDTSKALCHARVWAMLLPEEQRVVNDGGRGIAPSKRHNMLDAVGIGLWALGRLRK